MKSVAKTPKIAIVTPVYNGAEYLAETMASVQAQTHAELVHVVLDNASIDATPDIIGRFVGGRIPVIVHRNTTLLSQVDNWNKAVTLVPDDVDYFVVLSADDLLDPRFCAELSAAGERDRGAVVMASRIASSRGHEVTFGLPASRSSFTHDEIARGYLQLMHAGFISNMVMYRRSVIDPSRPFFDDRFLYIDLDRVLSLLEQGSLAYVNEILGVIRQHKSSVTAIEAKAKGRGMTEFLNILDKHGRGLFSAREFQRIKRMHTRRLHCRMLLLRFVSHNMDAYRTHRMRLEATGEAPDTIDYTIAVLDFAPSLTWRALRRQWRKATNTTGAADIGRRPQMAPRSQVSAIAH